jgi:hypothetical protein
MLINLDHDFKRITLGGKPQSKVCRHLRQNGLFALREEKQGEEINWEWADVEIGKNSFLL